ncbi:hypothetical protein MHAE_18242 [Mycobacterium haemophilum DSM 44634]
MLIVEPIFAKSVAAAVTLAGTALTYDIPHLRPAALHPGGRPAQVIVEPCGNTDMIPRTSVAYTGLR